MEKEELSLSFYTENDEYVFLHSFYDILFDGTLIESYKYGSLVTELANADLNDVIKCINFHLPEGSFLDEEYLNKCYENLIIRYSKTLSILIICDIIAATDESNNTQTVTASMHEWALFLNIKQKLSIEICNYSFKEVNQAASSIQYIKTTFIIDENTKKLKMIYNICDVLSIISIEACNIQAHGVIIHRCENCNKFFIPQIRNDEIYCQNIFKNNKTCKDIGYELKIQNDKFMVAYRTAYKTMKARESRITDKKRRIKYNNEYTEKWVGAIKSEMDLYKTNDDIDGFKTYLKKNMEQYKPRREGE